MKGFWTMLKMNIRLLLRNKGFLFFLMFAPILSTIILGLKNEPALFEEEGAGRIIELDEPGDRAVYRGDTMALIIKVYDASGTDLSEYVLEELAGTEMFSVCRADAENMTEKEVLKQAKKDAFDDRVGVMLYLKKDFDQGILEGDYEKAMLLYEVSEDERQELFENDLKTILGRILLLTEGTGMDRETALKILTGVEEELPERQIISLSGQNDISLNEEQSACRDRIGYALAIITLGFLFCGVCVAHTVIEERENKVYTRVMLSGTGQGKYLAAKLAMAVLISGMQTLLLGICMFVLGDTDFGIDKSVFLTGIFLLGLIFSVISFCTGILVGNVMAANYVVFALWSISALLAGLYFPLNETTPALKAISYLMPQKWFMRAAEMMLSGDKNVYSMVLCITAAYLIVIMSIGGVGLKMKRADA